MIVKKLFSDPQLGMCKPGEEVDISKLDEKVQTRLLALGVVVEGEKQAKPKAKKPAAPKETK